MEDNIKLLAGIKASLDAVSPVELGVNKHSEIVRLLYEICKRENIPVAAVLGSIGIEGMIKGGKGGFFRKLKSSLMARRYHQGRAGKDTHLMPVVLEAEETRDCGWNGRLDPFRIFIEKDAEGMPLSARIVRSFPKARVSIVRNLPEALKICGRPGAKDAYPMRMDNVFIVTAKAGLIKKCPCSPKCVGCGYLVLNMGFGCPMGCDYCYLKAYTDIPGILFPANVDDFLEELSVLDRKAGPCTRIGTGEFTDSLALDRYTLYSEALIPFFAGLKNLVLELKTKRADIDTVLCQVPNRNVVLSWSLNTADMSALYEKGASTLDERLHAAGKAAEKGFDIGFHFDPLIFHKGWEESYADLVSKVFSVPSVREKCRWVSLGTLRYSPGLKEAFEKDRPDLSAYYEGEFFTDLDGKLRYDKSLRSMMYRHMAGCIADSGVNAAVYLCMETEEAWRASGLKAGQMFGSAV
ncbi:MAG: radical SAM protein [Candidatus Omnitrophica bacterium]|nr:radical SAM protein [Candidatus Omnitrophota bacterium]